MAVFWRDLNFCGDHRDCLDLSQTKNPKRNLLQNFIIEYLLGPVLVGTASMILGLFVMKYNAWIDTASFWSYIGNILGTLIGGALAFYVLLKTVLERDK